MTPGLDAAIRARLDEMTAAPEPWEPPLFVELSPEDQARWAEEFKAALRREPLAQIRVLPPSKLQPISVVPAEQLLAALRAALDLHPDERHQCPGPHSGHARVVSWEEPCPTQRAIARELGIDPDTAEDAGEPT